MNSPKELAASSPKHADATIAKLLAPDALQRLLGDVWPEMRLETRAMDRSGGRHTLEWFDGDKLVGETDISVSRSKDGSLSLFGGGMLIDPEYRGRGVPNRLVPKLVAALQEASPHPNTRITVGAGAAGGEKMGAYFWANFGFDFANIHGDRVEINEWTSARSYYGLEPEPQVFRRAFATWLDTNRSEGKLPDDDKLIAALKEASTHWQHSWEVANFHVPGLKVDTKLRDKTFKYPLGKAFLMDPKTPTWAGVFFVNDTASPSVRILAAYTRLGVGRNNGST